ncbi:MAG: ABC transporter substrate-binding protein [Lachnospiraceae bacterium]
MKKWKKRIAAVLGVSLLFAFVTGCGSEKTDSDTIRLGVFTGGADQFLAVIGQEQGIFEKHKIQIKTTEFASGIGTVDAMVTGQEDMGLITDYAGVNRIGSTKEDCNIKILACYTTADSFWTFYANPKLATSTKDLANQGVTAIPGTALDYYNAVTFQDAGIEKKEQKLVNVDSEQVAVGIIANGEAAGGWLSAGSAAKAEAQGLKPILTMKDLGLTVDGYYVANDSFLKEKESTAEAFLAAIQETEKWVADHPDDAVKTIEEKTNMPQEQVKASLQANHLVLDLDDSSLEHLTQIKNWAIKEGVFTQDFDIQQYVDTKPIQQLK